MEGFCDGGCAFGVDFGLEEHALMFVDVFFSFLLLELGLFVEGIEVVELIFVVLTVLGYHFAAMWADMYTLFICGLKVHYFISYSSCTDWFTFCFLFSFSRYRSESGFSLLNS